jgi:hypothetical protein
MHLAPHRLQTFPMELNGAFTVLSLHGDHVSSGTWRRRRLHQKVRSGCLACRAKRVKVGYGAIQANGESANQVVV